MRTLQGWFDFCASRGTSGDQVFDILADWKAAERRADADEIAARAVAGILDDLTGRSGLEDEWLRIDRDIRAEIVGEWQRIIREALDK